MPKSNSAWVASTIAVFPFRNFRQSTIPSKVNAKMVIGTATPIANLSLVSRPTDAVLGEDAFCGRKVGEAWSTDDDGGMVGKNGSPTEFAAVIGCQKAVRGGPGSTGDGVQSLNLREETYDVNASGPNTVSLVADGLETEKGGDGIIVFVGDEVTHIPFVGNTEMIP